MCIVKFWKRNHLFPTTIYLYILKTIFILLLCWLVRLHSAASSSIYVADFYVRGFGGVEEFYKKTIKILMNTKPLIRNQMMNHYSVRKPIKLCFVPVTFLRCVCVYVLIQTIEHERKYNRADDEKSWTEENHNSALNYF